MNKNAKNNALNCEKKQKFLINCIFILIYEVFNVQKLLFFSVLQTIETSFGFMTHLKDCMQRQLLKSPQLSFGLAKFQLPLSVLLKRVSLSNKDRCGEQRACIRCNYLPSSDDFLSIPKNISISVSNLISCLHFIDKLGFI